MRINRAIEIFKQSVNDILINDTKEYKFIKACRGNTCSCVSGIDIGRLKLNNGWIIMSNGYTFRTSGELGNSLEDVWMQILHRDNKRNNESQL